MPKPTVREQQTKCKDLRKHLVTWVEALELGEWELGIKIAENVQAALKRNGIFTSGEVLAKELRKAQRKGEITKRIRPGTVFVEYTACAPSGELFDNSLEHHGE